MMPRARECDFCGDDIEPGTGTMFVRTDGATVHYCSSKCEKNHDLGREARNLEWTEAGRPDEDDEEPAEPTEAAPDLEAAEGEATVEAEEDRAETGVEAEADEAGSGAADDSESESENGNESEEETEAEV